MDVSKLTRDPAAVLAAIKKAGDASIATKPLKVYAPARYIHKGLGEVGANTRIFGFFAIVLDDKYAVFSAMTVVPSQPDSTSIVQIEGEDYYEYSYEAGSKFISNRNAVMVDTVVYFVFDMMIGRAKIPWFANIADIAKIFITASEHAGASIYDSNVVIEMILSQLVRLKKDKTIFFRTTGKDINSPSRDEFAIVPLRSPLYGSTNTTSAIIGAYYDDSLMTAISNPSERVEPIEKLLNS